MEYPIYIGDGIYLDKLDEDFLLYTSNGLDEDNKIWLDPQSVSNLLKTFQIIREYNENQSK